MLLVQLAFFELLARLEGVVLLAGRYHYVGDRRHNIGDRDLLSHCFGLLR